MYEACGEGFAEPTEYVRQMLPVTLADGTVSEAWTYIYNWPVGRIDLLTDRLGRGFTRGVRFRALACRNAPCE